MHVLKDYRDADQVVSDIGGIRIGGRSLVKWSAIAFASLALAGCSYVPDELNPVEWASAVDEWISGEDEELDPEALRRIESERSQAIPGEDESFPTLGSVPDDRPDFSTREDRDAIAAQLIADRSNARYTEEAVGAVPEDQTPWRDSNRTSPAPVAPAPEIVPEPEAALPAPRAPVAEARPAPTVAPPPRPYTEERAYRDEQAIQERRRSMERTAVVVVQPPPVPQVPGWTTVEQEFYRMFAASGGPDPRYSGMTATDYAAATPSYSPTVRMAAAAPGYSPVVGGANTGAMRSLDDFNPLSVESSMQAAVVYFNHGSSKLSRQDREVLRQVAAAYKEYDVTVRVVGHSSSRTKTSKVVAHKIANYEISVNRARAVARQLVKLGVAPGSLYVGAMADTKPKFSEATPMGEAANRRADVYLDFRRRSG